MPKTLIIIDPAIKHAEVECTEWLSKQTPYISSIHYPALQGCHSLWQIQFSSIAGVIILGSGASPQDSTLLWQQDLIHWFTNPHGVLQQKVPILGICYGHQLLAHIFGSTIEYLWHGNKASGLRWVHCTDPHFPLRKAIPLVVSHREGFKTPPQDWHTISSSSLMNLGSPSPNPQHYVTAVEAMKHNRHPWWGFQSHIEAVPAFLANNQVNASLPQPYAGHLIIQTFLHVVYTHHDHTL